MSMDEYLDQLGRAHGFTLDELRANQRGALHPAQLARGLREGRGAVVVFTVLGALALFGGLGGAYAYYDSLGPAPSRVDLNALYAIGAGGGLLTLALFAGAYRSLAGWRAHRAAYARGRIDVLEGAVDKVHVQGVGRSDEYYFRVGDRSFDASRALWELLTQGATYRLYCVADDLLSLAPVDDDPHERAEYERELAQFERTRHIPPYRYVK